MINVLVFIAIVALMPLFLASLSIIFHLVLDFLIIVLGLVAKDESPEEKELRLAKNESAVGFKRGLVIGFALYLVGTLVYALLTR